MKKREKSASSPHLPIFMNKSKILEKIKTHQVVIITGQTGCGKSTQVPKYLFESGYGVNGVIACLHPRCVAAMSLADRVSKELKTNLGGLVGYQVRFHRMSSNETKILFMTTGSMLMMMKDSGCINKYSVVVIDEAHERSIQTDIIMGLMKEILKENNFIKLVIMSATLDVEQIRNYYEGSAVIPISNTTDKLKVIYRPLTSQNYISAIKVIVEEILKKSIKGHILIFLQSEEKVYKCKKQLNNLKLTKSLPFFASMDEDEKHRVFQEYPRRRKIIIATNVAETSLTIPGVDYVIDSGLVKRIYFDYETGVEKWMTKYISIAEADQRKGRTGRTGIGTCYRLYDEKCIKYEPVDDLISQFKDLSNVDSSKPPSQSFPTKKGFKPHIELFKKFPEPEIATVNLNSMVLTLKSMNRKNMDFPFIVPPDENKVKKSVKELQDLSLLNEEDCLTKIGKIAGKLPLEPRLGKVATIATELLCRQDVNKIIAMLCVRNVLKYPSKSLESPHHKFVSKHGDLFQLLNIFNEAIENEFSGWWCEENSIDRSCLKYAYKVFNQLEWILSAHQVDNSFYNTCNENMVKKVFLSGFFCNVARKSDEGVKYLSVDDKVLSVHKVSCLEKSEEIVFFQSIQKPTGADEIIIKNCTSLNKQMLMNLKPQKFKIKAPLWKAIIEKQLKS